MTGQVAAKKHLGQHFLNDLKKAGEIVSLLTFPTASKNVLEIGPGMGVLTDFLFEKKDVHTKCIDIDSESIRFLASRYPDHVDKIIEGDFLRFDLRKVFMEDFSIIGNFPYNISTQILFKVLEHRDIIPEVVGMFQKEVAERIAGEPGNREYGILSVFMQAWYDVTLEMILDESDFNPPPKVKSAVLRFKRKENFQLGCDEKLFRIIVKTAFNQRRKSLRNALASVWPREVADMPFVSLRAEALSWQKFVELTNAVAQSGYGK